MNDINKMSTLSILWHIVYRHRVVLLITSNFSMIVWYIVTHTAKDFMAFVAK